MKDEILKLRNENKTYDEICDILGCSKSTVAWHCSKEVREKSQKARNKNRRKAVYDLKMDFGGKCQVCGYNKCLSALHFHHKNPKQKVEDISWFLHKKGKKAAIKEAKKCILICGNCHYEFHEGLIDLC